MFAAALVLEYQGLSEADCSTNVTKQKLKAGECVYGTSLEDCLDPEVAVLLAATGLDFFFVRYRAFPASLAQVQALCRSGRGAGITPLVRVTENEPALISRALDVGAAASSCRAYTLPSRLAPLSTYMKFPPLGHRGFGLRRDCQRFQGRPSQTRASNPPIGKHWRYL